MSTSEKSELFPDCSPIVDHYDRCLERHGENHQGMDWPNKGDLQRRFAVMLEVIRQTHVPIPRLLDLGCGVGLLLDYMKDHALDSICSYTGLDISSRMIEAARKRHADAKFIIQDILAQPFPDSAYDYIVMNGVLTVKVSLSHKEMECYAQRLITTAFQAASQGIAFNVMSSHVDWERDDLFHWPLDAAVDFIIKHCSRNIVIRMDYGLYEYTAYVYKEPFRG